MASYVRISFAALAAALLCMLANGCSEDKNPDILWGYVDPGYGADPGYTTYPAYPQKGVARQKAYSFGGIFASSGGGASAAACSDTTSANNACIAVCGQYYNGTLPYEFIAVKKTTAPRLILKFYRISGADSWTLEVQRPDSATSATVTVGVPASAIHIADPVLNDMPSSTPLTTPVYTRAVTFSATISLVNGTTDLGQITASDSITAVQY